MNNAEERIRWFLRFTEMDFAQFRRGDWMNLEDDLLRHMGQLPLKEHAGTAETLRPLQAAISELLTDVVAGPPLPSLDEASQEIRLPFQIEARDVKRITLSFRNNGWAFMVEADSLRTTLLFSLARTLAELHDSGALDRLRQCPECRRLFFAQHGRQQFCSARCKSRDASRRYRAENKEKLADKAHEQYRKKVELKSNGKVQRRKRTTKQRKET